jgi:hypothetical protein
METSVYPVDSYIRTSITTEQIPSALILRVTEQDLFIRASLRYALIDADDDPDARYERLFVAPLACWT